MSIITDTVASRRMVARSLVPSNVQALESQGLEVSNLDGIEYRVAGKAAFFPKNGFWRFLDGSRQGYGASRLIPALSGPVAPARASSPIADELVGALRSRQKRKPEKPAAIRDSTAPDPDRSCVAAEVAAGDSSSRLPAVWS